MQLKESCRSIALWTGLVIALAAVRDGASAQPALVPVRMATSNFDTAAEPFYADETGIFRRAGIRATIRRGLLPDAVLRGVVSGSIDIAFADSVSIISAIERGLPIAVLAPGGVYLSSAPITVLVQSPTSDFHSGKDLEGKTVATPGRNDEGRLAIKAWADQTGGDASLIHFVTGVPPATAWIALRDRRIDAMQISEPAQTVQRGKIKEVAPTLDALGHHLYIGFFFTSKAWLAAHPGLARRFTTAIYATARWANAHHRESGAILVKRLHLKPNVVATMRRATYAQTLRPEWIQPVVDAGVKYGAFGPISVERIIGSARGCAGPGCDR